MKKLPEISIIVPAYHAEKYLKKCIDSILGQTHKDFELLLIDDGSKDASGNICDEYARQDRRIKVIHKKNEGVSAARNTGIQNAKGKYLMFCDSDDHVADTWCETLYNQICLHPYALVVSDVARGQEGDTAADRYHDAVHVTELSDFQLYKKGISAYTVNKIYSHNMIAEHGLQFDEACSFSEDAAFNSEYCQYCEKIIYIDRPLYFYVQREGSIMNRYYPDLFRLHLLPFRCRLPLMQGHELTEYCDIWLYQFCQLFSNVFDERNNMSLVKKLQYNQEMMNTKEFKFCMEHASGKNENPVFMKLLRMHHYYLVWLFEKMVQMKKGIHRG